MDAAEVFQQVPLFRGLAKKEIDQLARMAHERSFPSGTDIVKEGDAGIGLFAIVSGQVEVLQKRGGSEQSIRTMGPGQVFGEVGLLTDHPRTATVRATSPTDCLVLSVIDFRGSLTSSPDMAKQLLGTVAQWLVEAEDRAARV